MPRASIVLAEWLRMEVVSLAAKKGLDSARVAHKVNARGELVVALILPPSRPGEWTDA